jgi:hypothetical protein
MLPAKEGTRTAMRRRTACIQGGVKALITQHYVTISCENIM